MNKRAWWTGMMAVIVNGCVVSTDTVPGDPGPQGESGPRGPSQWEDCTNGICYNGGHVGIGTETPNLSGGQGRYLTIADDAGPQSNGRLELANMNSNIADPNFFVGEVTFLAGNNPGLDKRVAQIFVGLDGKGGDNGRGGKILFFTKADNAQGPVPRMILAPNGEVGVGTGSPTAMFDAVGTSDVAGYVLRSQRTDGTAKTRILGQGDIRLQTGEGPIDDFTAMNTRLTVTRNGAVGVNNEAPSQMYDLHVGIEEGRIRAGYFHVDGLAYISQSGVINNQNDIGIYTNDQERITISNQGQVGIGVLNPSFTLQVGDCSANNCAAKPGGGTWTDSSDARLKQNIAPLPEALSRLLRLHGVTYEWREPDKHGHLTGPQTGMIAQEVEKVFPEWVGTDREGFKTLTIRGFEALAIESFRELKTENDTLRREVAALTGKADRTAKLEADLAAERAARQKLEARLTAIETKLAAPVRPSSH